MEDWREYTGAEMNGREEIHRREYRESALYAGRPATGRRSSSKTGFFETDLRFDPGRRPPSGGAVRPFHGLLGATNIDIPSLLGNFWP